MTMEEFLAKTGNWYLRSDRSGKNRENGTVSYNDQGVCFYEFRTREDAARYLFDGDRDMPYAVCELIEQEADEDEDKEEEFTDYEFENDFNPAWLADCK